MNKQTPSCPLARRHVRNGVHIASTRQNMARRGKTDEEKERGAVEWVVMEGFMEGVVS